MRHRAEENVLHGASGTNNVAGACGRRASVQVYDWSQNAVEIWQGSNTVIRREILDSVCLNRTLSDVKLVTTKRKPFDVFAERPQYSFSRGDRI